MQPFSQINGQENESLKLKKGNTLSYLIIWRYTMTNQRIKLITKKKNKLENVQTG